VTLSCTMAYRRLTEQKGDIPGAGFSASIDWEPAAGTSVNKSSTALANDVGETLHVEVMMLASETEIPSYNCTAEFQFTNKVVNGQTFALNNVSWTCVSPNVSTWCMYSS